MFLPARRSSRQGRSNRTDFRFCIEIRPKGRSSLSPMNEKSPKGPRKKPAGVSRRYPERQRPKGPRGILSPINEKSPRDHEISLREFLAGLFRGPKRDYQGHYPILFSIKCLSLLSGRTIDSLPTNRRQFTANIADKDHPRKTPNSYPSG